MYDAARAAQASSCAGTHHPFQHRERRSERTDARGQRLDPRVRRESRSGVVFCDTRAAVAAPGQPDRLVSSPDDLHPSPDGYRRMAIALEPAIAEATVKAGGGLRHGNHAGPALQ